MVLPEQKDALRFVEHFFQAYIHVDVDSISRMICEQDPQTVGQVRAFIQHSQAPDSPFRIERYQVRSAVPMWIGREPYFRVEVSFPRRAGRGEILHQYRVRVRNGCLEGLLELGSEPKPSLPPPGSSGDVDDGDDDDVDDDDGDDSKMPTAPLADQSADDVDRMGKENSPIDILEEVEDGEPLDLPQMSDPDGVIEL